MDTEQLQKRIEQEKREIDEAPRVASTGYVQRCHFCGRLAERGSAVRGPHELHDARFRGECCGG